MGNVDERYGFINTNMLSEEVDSTVFFDPLGEYSSGITNELVPFDLNGNVRVIRVYWKSRRRIKKIKYYNKETGEEEFTFMPESYITNQYAGEEEESFWVNEAWEGTKIGDSIYVNMRPRVIQYNRLSNPSRCHFGIVGSIYNLNDSKPFSLVDMMKPYNYLYDAIHDRLNKAIASNWGKIITVDLAKVPKGWDMEKWLHYAKINKIAVEDSFKEGNIGAATGKLAGALNNASSGVIDAEFGNSIQQQINLLEFIKMEMSEVAGITRQREGQVSNRETVGGVERATLQSSHITEWLFVIHDDVKKIALECFLETAKIALMGRSKKFQYILSDMSQRIIDIDGDEFSECDYGLAVDNSNSTQELKANLPTLVQAGLQNNKLSFSTAMRIWNSNSVAEQQRMIENDEQRMMEMQQQAAQQAAQAEQQRAEIESQAKMAELEAKDRQNQRDNETKLLIATLQSDSKGMSEAEKANLDEKVREFDDNLEFQKKKQEKDSKLKREQINKKTTAK